MFDDIHFLSNVFPMSVTSRYLHSVDSDRDHLRKASCPLRRLPIERLWSDIFLFSPCMGVAWPDDRDDC